jgi:hypothetical protein
MWQVLSVVLMLLAGCVQLPLTPQDIQARKFEPVPDRAVVYLVRDHPDFSDRAATIWLGESVMITTYPGTYFRWETAPGTHRITGYGPDIGTITLRLEPGRIYFVQQQLAPFMQLPFSQFFLVNEPSGRAAVNRAVLLGGQ